MEPKPNENLKKDDKPSPTAQTNSVNLTKREKEVMILMYQELCTKQIAATLKVSRYAIESQEKVCCRGSGEQICYHWSGDRTAFFDWALTGL